MKVPGDISEEAQCQAVIQKAVDEFGRIDILVNNAAHQMTVDGIADVSTELLDRTFKTNIYAMFWLVKAALPHMPEGGSIINVGSIQAYQPSPPLLPYSSTKGAIVTFTKGLAQEVVQYGLRANTVAPGPCVDPDHPRLHARRHRLPVRRHLPDGPPGPARGARPRLRLPRLPGGELRQRRDARRNGGQPLP